MVEWKIKGLYKANAEKVYSEIKELGESFSPADVVEAAKDKNSELHKCFTWDDTVAAEKWRKQEARVLAANLAIKVKYLVVKELQNIFEAIDEL